MDKLNHLLEEQIRELRDTAPRLRNGKELTDSIMNGIHENKSNHLLHQTWVRLVLNTAAIGLIAFFLLQTKGNESASASTHRNATHLSLQESQAGNLLRQATSDEALPTYLGFLQQRSLENKHFRSIRPTTKYLAL